MPAAVARRSLKPHVASSALLSFALLAEPSNDIELNAANPKWIQVCRTGTFKGYRGGAKQFTITEDTFRRVQANLRAHPSYVAGADTLPAEEAAALVVAGKLGVVPFDIDHVGGPAEAWGLEVDIRPLANGEGFGLWMLVHFLEPAYTWMLDGRFRWTSITWEENATDPVSGEKIGPYVISVALTNDPFVQGMTAIQQGRTFAMSGSWDPWCPPRSATELLVALRRLFGLPEVAGLEAVLASVSALRAWSSGELQAPVGVDVAQLVGDVRLLLNLPTLSDAAIIFGELDKLLGAIAEEEAHEETTPMPAPITPPAPADPITAAARGIVEPHIVTHFAAKLKVEASEPVVTVELERRLSRADDALALVDALMKATGSKSGEDLSAKITELVAIKARMDELLPEMEAAAASAEGDAELSAEQDVAAVMQTRAIPEELHDALLLQRRGGSADYFAKLPAKERKASRDAARTAFLKRYEVSTVDVPKEYQHLLGRQLFAGPHAVFGGLGGRPAQGGPVSGQPASFGPQGAPPPPPQDGVPTWDEVNLYEGANDAERVCSFVRSKEPRLSYDQAWTRADKLRNAIIQRQGPSPV